MDLSNRKFLIDLREAACAMLDTPNLNPDWARAYENLAVAADHLDAINARCEIPVEVK